MAYGNWDGESAAIGSCAIGEAGEACRSRSLARDKLIDYGALSNKIVDGVRKSSRSAPGNSVVQGGEARSQPRSGRGPGLGLPTKLCCP